MADRGLARGSRRRRAASRTEQPSSFYRVQQALFESGIPQASFAVDDIAKEHERLLAEGVAFKMEPTDVGGAIVAVLDDSCGNFVQIYQT